jgi:hypothetical protein
MNLIFAKRLLMETYLELVNDAMQGKKLPTAEEKAVEFIEKLDPCRKI